MTSDGTIEAADAAKRLLASEPGLLVIGLDSMAALRDAVYQSEPALFVGGELALTSEAALLWLPRRPGSIVEIRWEGDADISSLRVLPGVEVVGSTPENTSSFRFWQRELADRRNLVAWLLATLGLTAPVVTFGPRVLESIPPPLSVFFGVLLPVLPLFFRPAVGADLLPFFRSGRLARWHLAERQMLNVAVLGFVGSISLQVALADRTAAGWLAAIAWPAVVAVVLAAVWLLLALVGYALPLVHSLDTSRAAREWRASKLSATMTSHDQAERADRGNDQGRATSGR